MNEPQAFLNGRWIPASAAAIPVGDSGFVQGATVAEQVRTFGGRLFRLGDHLARLERSLRVVGVDPGMTLQQFTEVAEELVARNHRLLASGDDLGLSIVVTPGPYAPFAADPGARSRGPTICLHTYALPFHLWAEKYGRGEALVISKVEQVSPGSWPPALKCRSRMHYFLADRQAAQDDPGARALLLDREGFVTEASTANVVVSGSPAELWCPPPEKILPGISLAVLAELAAAIGVGLTPRDLTPREVASADEVMLASTSVCLLPVTRLNGRPVGSGRPGALYRRLLAAWSDLVGVDVAGQAARFARRGLTGTET